MDTEVAFSGAAFNSAGLTSVRLNEMDRAFAPKLPNKVASGLGSAFEVGLGVDSTKDNQIIIAGKAEVAAPPNVGAVTKQAGPVNADPLAWADLLRGQSFATVGDGTCALGTDASRGLAYITDVQLLDTASGSTASNGSRGSGSSGPAAPSASASKPAAAPLAPSGSASDPLSGLSGVKLSGVNQTAQGLAPAPSSGSPTKPAPAAAAPTAPKSSSSTSSSSASAVDPEGLEKPMVALDATDPARAISQSRSRTVFVAQRGRNGKLLGNAFGMMSEVRETIAPVTLFKGTDNQFTIEFLGEWVLQAIAGGIPGTGYVHYGPAAKSPDTPVLRLIDAEGENRIITLQQLVTDKGLIITIPGAAEIAIGEPPRAINGAAGSRPLVTSDGTKAAAAVDVVRVMALPGADFQLSDLRVGHMEVQTAVPAGGVSCSIPVKKTPSTDSVDVGQEFMVDFVINNPYDCTLSNVSLSDVITTEGAARFEVMSTDPTASSSPTGSSLSSDTILWSNVGDIAPHKSRTLHATIGARRGEGAILDTATARAKLTKCADKGTSIAGVDVGVVNSAINGVSQQVRVPVVATRVKAAFSNRLPRTGAAIMWLAIAALALIAMGGTGIAVARRLR